MTDDEAETLRKQLEEHYKEPVRPISFFCDSIKTWFRCIERRNEDGKDGQGKDYHRQLQFIEIDIEKSDLLFRLIYQGQKLRTQKCSIHKGKWSGIPFPGDECPEGCGHTGWLPEK